MDEMRFYGIRVLDFITFSFDCESLFCLTAFGRGKPRCNPEARWGPFGSISKVPGSPRLRASPGRRNEAAASDPQPPASSAVPPPRFSSGCHVLTQGRGFVPPPAPCGRRRTRAAPLPPAPSPGPRPSGGPAAAPRPGPVPVHLRGRRRAPGRVPAGSARPPLSELDSAGRRAAPFQAGPSLSA